MKASVLLIWGLYQQEEVHHDINIKLSWFVQLSIHCVNQSRVFFSLLLSLFTQEVACTWTGQHEYGLFYHNLFCTNESNLFDLDHLLCQWKWALLLQLVMISAPWDKSTHNVYSIILHGFDFLPHLLKLWWQISSRLSQSVLYLEHYRTTQRLSYI